jgi:hypothetical protein
MLDRGAVEHRQRAGQRQVDRRDLGAPNAVDAPEKILLCVASCAWVSIPITTSQLI